MSFFLQISDSPMNAPSLSPPTATPPVRKRRWWLPGTLAAVTLAIAAPLAMVIYSEHGSHGAWAEAEAEASRDDPRWRLLEMEADRPQLADADNSALHVMAIHRKGRIHIPLVPNYDQVFDKLPANTQLNAQQVQLIRTEFAKIPGQIEAARKLKDMPEGRFPLTISDEWITTLIPHHHEPREIADWLKHDAWLLAQEGDSDAAIESCQAIINAGRSVKDDPFLITCLVRLALQNIALDTLERVLAQGEASEGHLSALQAMLEREMREESLIRAMRGERAGAHFLFENLRDGKAKLNHIFVNGPGMGVNTGDPFTDWLSETFPSTMLKHFPDHLHYMNRTVAAVKLPLHERPAKLAELSEEVKRSRNPVMRLLAPAMDKVEKSDRRVHIYLRCMVVALACERYRLKDEAKRWPATLDDLVKAKLLDAVPTDPIDKQPLRYRRTKEEIVIYSIGFDMKDNQGNIDRAQPYNEGVDLGFRLWDPAQRRRQPLPPIAFPGAGP
jgi:hypothetical protein